MDFCQSRARMIIACLFLLSMATSNTNTAYGLCCVSCEGRTVCAQAVNMPCGSCGGAGGAFEGSPSPPEPTTLEGTLVVNKKSSKFSIKDGTGINIRDAKLAKTYSIIPKIQQGSSIDFTVLELKKLPFAEAGVELKEVISGRQSNEAVSINLPNLNVLLTVDKIR
jgi:hypothetical protein